MQLLSGLGAVTPLIKEAPVLRPIQSNCEAGCLLWSLDKALHSRWRASFTAKHLRIISPSLTCSVSAAVSGTPRLCFLFFSLHLPPLGPSPFWAPLAGSAQLKSSQPLQLLYLSAHFTDSAAEGSSEIWVEEMSSLQTIVIAVCILP